MCKSTQTLQLFNSVFKSPLKKINFSSSIETTNLDAVLFAAYSDAVCSSCLQVKSPYSLRRKYMYWTTSNNDKIQFWRSNIGSYLKHVNRKIQSIRLEEQFLELLWQLE